jgi:hypothetical protein
VSAIAGGGAATGISTKSDFMPAMDSGAGTLVKFV